MKGNRRQFIGAGAAAALGRRSLAAQPRKDDRIAEENRRAGTREWQLQYTRFDDPVTMASYPLNRKVRSSGIEGYASRTSVAPGETIEFLVLSASPILINRLFIVGVLGAAFKFVLNGPAKAQKRRIFPSRSTVIL
jgi:hypothetical protein